MTFFKRYFLDSMKDRVEKNMVNLMDHHTSQPQEEKCDNCIGGMAFIRHLTRALYDTVKCHVCDGSGVIKPKPASEPWKRPKFQFE